ncbi:MAG TPA: hypothetical protein VG916_10950, partial [Gemmatimonadaceae bacterium]|nr:hypothetical protein [Gemmatimonadaceae bacterium]
MPGSDRAEAGSARSTHVVHYMAPDWPAVAERIAPLLARADAAAPAVQVLVLVPSASDATDVARALAATPRAPGIGAWNAPRRAQRLARATHPPVVVATPAVIAGLLAASAVSLSGVTGIAFAAADELEADATALETVLAEVPAGAAKI